LALGARYDINEIRGGAIEAVSDGIAATSFGALDDFVAVKMFAGDTTRVFTALSSDTCFS
jgi:hypothetical protein